MQEIANPQVNDEEIREIVIPYSPRFPQNLIHTELEKKRFYVLVAHRRMGKTVLLVNHIIKKAIQSPLPSPRYAYIAPFMKQARLISWDYFKRFAGVIPGVKINESETTITLPNGAKIYLFGADNPDALRGTYLDGCVLDEYAQIKPEVFPEIIRPTLADRNGWCVFSGTPKGQNHFFEVYEQAQRLVNEGDEHWGHSTYRADETKVLPEDELAQVRSITAESSYRQEYLCDFTAASDNILIPIDMIIEACQKKYTESDLIRATTVMGVDVARYGDDRSVILWRSGLKCYEPRIFQGADNMQLVGEITRIYNELKPDALFVDAGRGEGVIDRLRQLHYPVIEVNFGGKPSSASYNNKRSEMWDKIREWLTEGGSLPDIPEIKQDLSAPTYDFDAANRLRLEPKDKIKERLGRSTDLGDALALTFAQPVFNHLDLEMQRELPRKAITR